jgi:signal transduction histidine kinase
VRARRLFGVLRPFGGDLGRGVAVSAFHVVNGGFDTGWDAIGNDPEMTLIPARAISQGDSWWPLRRAACDHRSSRPTTIEERSISTPITSPPGSAPVPPRLGPQIGPAAPYRKLYRRAEGRYIAGIAAGIAAHLQVPVVWVRVAFVLLLLPTGVGAILYAAFWAMLDVDPAERAVGKGSRRLGQLFAFIALAVAVQVVLAIVGYSGPYLVLWFLGVAAVGGVLIWRRADDGQRQRWTDLAPNHPWVAMIVARDRTATTIRLVGGGVLVLVGLIGGIASTGELSAVRDGLLVGIALLAGAGVVVAPWLVKIVGDLRDEQRERIRSQERAEIAAIVHDQVLHTLALIQRSADDSREVTRLARGQERELRNWLYKPAASPTERVAAALEAVAAEVEDTYAIAVDAVVVGDCDVDERLLPLMHAAREALVNAAKHAKVASVSLYAEVEPQQVSVFVRDRGAGFDVDSVEEDRHGVRGSIVGRMKRHGGTATIRSSPGEGTEVRLMMQRGAAP